MNIKKKLLFYFSITLMVSSVFAINANAVDMFSNLSDKEKSTYMENRVSQSNNNYQSSITSFDSSGGVRNETFPGIVITQSGVKGDIYLENSVFNKDFIVTSNQLKNLYIKNTLILGDLYIVDASSDLKITLENSQINVIYLASPTKIDIVKSASSAPIVVLTKHLKPQSYVTINGNTNKVVNYANGVNLVNNGTINTLVANKALNIGGKYKYLVKTSNDFSLKETIYYDLKDLSISKGFNNLNDGTSFQDLYNLFKKEQYSYKNDISFIIKNTTDSNINQLAKIISNYFVYIVPSNNTGGIYTQSYSNLNFDYGLYNVHMFYDTNLDKIRQSEKVIDSMYDSIKHLNGVDFVKAVNKMISLHIVYDDVNTAKHSLYDAVIMGSAVCDGYSKMGYELLSRKFGKENNILVANSDHMWNMLNLGGHWYHIDFTYNDPVTKPFNKNYYTEDYLLLTDSELIKETNGRTWDKNLYPSANNSLKSSSIF